MNHCGNCFHLPVCRFDPVIPMNEYDSSEQKKSCRYYMHNDLVLDAVHEYTMKQFEEDRRRNNGDG